jgi:hypothetical protein
LDYELHDVSSSCIYTAGHHLCADLSVICGPADSFSAQLAFCAALAGSEIGNDPGTEISTDVVSVSILHCPDQIALLRNVLALLPALSLLSIL